MTSISGSASYVASMGLISSSDSKPKSPLDVAANLFGMSKGDLATELKSGKSLTDVAKQKGVSADDLTSALAANDPSNASSADKLTRAKEIATKVGLSDRPHRREATEAAPTTTSGASTSSGSSGSSLLDELSSLLNTDKSTLTDQLKSGTSLSDLLSKNGVSMTSLASTVQQGLIYDNNL